MSLRILTSNEIFPSVDDRSLLRGNNGPSVGRSVGRPHKRPSFALSPGRYKVLYQYARKQQACHSRTSGTMRFFVAALAIATAWADNNATESSSWPDTVSYPSRTYLTD